MMTGYVLSVLGIVIAGVFIDIIVPSGSISKYIKGIYSIFVVAVLINPILKFLNKNHDFTVKYKDYEISSNLIEYIFKKQILATEKEIEDRLKIEGFSNIDISLFYSIENNELNYNSCSVNLKNLVISSDKQHINKYEFIKNIIKESTSLTEEEIIIDE